MGTLFSQPIEKNRCFCCCSFAKIRRQQESDPIDSYPTELPNCLFVGYVCVCVDVDAQRGDTLIVLRNNLALRIVCRIWEGCGEKMRCAGNTGAGRQMCAFFNLTSIFKKGETWFVGIQLILFTS